MTNDETPSDEGTKVIFDLRGSLNEAFAEHVTLQLFQSSERSELMPSPFPGMDPYLEHPDIFPDFHDRLITYISESLQSSLPEPYFAALGRRAWIEVSERYVGPDVNVLRTGQNKGASCESVAVADRAVTKPIVVHVPHDERSEPLVEIYTGRGSRRRLVTSIEVLSTDVKKGTGTFCRNGPECAAHKRFPSPFSHGCDLYLRKQKEILQSKVATLTK